MLTFKIQDSKVLFFCGNNVLGVFLVQTVKNTGSTRLAERLRDFGSIADRVLLVNIAKDALVDAGL